MTRSSHSRHAEDFAAFVRAEGPRLLRFATLLAGSQGQAEDLVQAALTSTFARWGSVATRDPAAYVRRAVVNPRTSAWRRTRREQLVAHLPERATEDRYDDSSELRAALAALSRPQRAVLLLRYLEDWDDAAIAAALSLSRSTVRSHARRGLAALRDQFAPDLEPARVGPSAPAPDRSPR